MFDAQKLTLKSGQEQWVQACTSLIPLLQY